MYGDGGVGHDGEHGDDGVRLVPGKWHRIHITLAGNFHDVKSRRITTYINGQRCALVTDTEADPSFKDQQVRRPPPATPTTGPKLEPQTNPGLAGPCGGAREDPSSVSFHGPKTHAGDYGPQGEYRPLGCWIISLKPTEMTKHTQLCTIYRLNFGPAPSPNPRLKPLERHCCPLCV